MSRGLVIGMLVGALFEFGPTLRAQSNLATLVGTVKDASGGVVPNAAVAVKNLGTEIRCQRRLLRPESASWPLLPHRDADRVRNHDHPGY